MADTRALVSALSYALTAAFYLYLGSRLLRRRATPGPGARAVGMFGVWWVGLASHSILAGGLALALAFGTVPSIVVAAATYLAATLIAGMSYGLVHYMAYLLTGRATLVRVITWAYVPLYLGILAGVLYAGPRGVAMEGWTPIIEYARPEGSALDLLASLAFIFPPFLASGFYAALWFRVKEPAKRWRIALTGGALFGWLVTSLLAGGLDGDLGAVVARSLALLAAIAAYLAYEPPRWAQRRYGAVPLHDEVVRPAPNPILVNARRQALADRARELV